MVGSKYGKYRQSIMGAHYCTESDMMALQAWLHGDNALSVARNYVLTDTFTLQDKES